MAQLRSVRGTRLVIELPPATKWKQLEQARADHERLKEEQRANYRRLEELSARREQALAEDRAALADALLASSEEPDDSAVEEVDREITAANRRAEALELALDGSEQKLIAAVNANRESWVSEQVRAVEKARKALEAKLAAYLEARHARAEESALLNWLRGFPDEQPNFRGAWDAPLAGVLGQNSEPIGWERIEAAMRADAEPPPPFEEPTYIPRGGMSLGTYQQGVARKEEAHDAA